LANSRSEKKLGRIILKKPDPKATQ